MQQINLNNIFWELITQKLVDSDCNHSKFKQWENETPELKQNLNKRGKIDISEKTWQNDEYWGDKAPIVFSWYPYHSCEIHQCTKCNEFFFHYIDDGGHGRQKRYRIIDIELIDKKDFKPERKTVIDFKGYEYSVYKSPNGDLQLDVCRVDVGLGINIVHKLEKSEQEEYYQNGIINLVYRMNDMKTNYSNYEVYSWR